MIEFLARCAFMLFTLMSSSVVSAMASDAPSNVVAQLAPVGRLRAAINVKSVHGDMQALVKAGVLVGADNGTIVFPYDEVHVDFVLRAARDDFSAGAMEEALPESCPRRGVHSKVVTVTPIPYVTRKILQRPGFAPARSRADIHTT